MKQLVNIRTILEVTEYHADVYYNSATGERVHAEFPAGVIDDVNYGGSIKAFRSFDTVIQLCQCMSMLIQMRQKEETNLFDRVSQIFG